MNPSPKRPVHWQRLSWLCCLLAPLLVGCGSPASAEPDTPASKGGKAVPGGQRPNARAPGPQRPAQPEFAEEDPGDPSPFRVRVKAPSLDGGVGWINTAGPLRIEDLRGKFVLLDFWTYCCINCMQLLPELKKLEHKYPNELVVIGVHSAKFDGEQETKNIAEAVERYEIHHPVVNDARHEIWDRYSVSAWPTLMIIDPEGYLVATHSGEIEVSALEEFFRSVMPFYKKRKSLDARPLRLDRGSVNSAATPLRFPGKVLADEASRRLVISDSGHNRIVVTDLSGKLEAVVGDGQAGDANGEFSKARFNHPQGTAMVGDAIYVADTENHLIRKFSLKTKRVRTVAGTGKQGHGFWPGLDRVRQNLATGQLDLPDKWECSPLKAKLASPWALAVHDGWLYIAMAGEHQIWRMSLDEKQIEVFAGDGREDIRDGKRVPASPPRLSPLSLDMGYASFAQPSGLASDGKWLFVADSEGSAVRAVPLAGDEPVRTVVGAANMPRGRALFTFGDQDGAGDEVRLQHVIGVATHGGRLYVADTYNNKIKLIDPKTRTARTISGAKEAGRQDEPPRFDEPSGISAAGGKLYVADTNNHAIRTIDLAEPHKVRTLEMAGLTAPKRESLTPTDPFEGAAKQTVPPVVCVAAKGKIRLKLKLDLPTGWKINPAGPMRYRVSAEKEPGPLDPAGLNTIVAVPSDSRDKPIVVELPVQESGGGETKLRVALAFYYCRDGKDGICKTGSVVWHAPLKISPDAPSREVLLEWKVKP